MIDEENRKRLARIVKARYTPQRVREMADEGMRVLKDIPRWENFAGLNKAVMAADGTTVIISRATDYERARFAPDEKSMIRACDAAVRSLGQRLDLCLQGEPIAKDFMGEIVRSKMHPATWAGGSTLYSLGPAPQLLDSDGVVIFPIAVADHDGSDDTKPVYRGDMLEVRFGYYANTGPTEK